LREDEDIFPAYYSHDEEWFKNLWSTATVALDANVLLNLYRYPTSARNHLFLVLRQLSDRLTVPYQAAAEYQIRRLTVIADQRRRFDEVKTVLSNVESQLRVDLDKLQLDKRHSSIKPDQLLIDIQEVMDKFRAKLDLLEKKQPDVLDDDPIRSSLDDLLNGKVGPIPTQKQLDDIYAEGKKRYERRLPPGFEDEQKSKDKEPFYGSNGVSIERRFGDLILWKQLIDIAKSKKLRSLILVTDDSKPDWWWIIESKGKKTIGPRPELVEEICQEADLENFYIYNSERFMQFASKYLGIQIRQESISQIGDIRQLLDESPHTFGLIVEESVYRWLCSINPSNRIKRNQGFPDFQVQLQDGQHVGYEVKLVGRKLLQKMVSGGPEQWQVLKHEKGLDKICFVLVTRSGEATASILAELNRWLAQLSDDIIVLLGHLEFTPDPANPRFVLKNVFNGQRESVGIVDPAGGPLLI
jgi:hypothetical protein